MRSIDETGARLSEAHQTYCRPDILADFQAAGERAGWSVRQVRMVSAAAGPHKTARNLAVDTYKSAWAAVKSDLIQKLLDGRLLAKGFLIGPTGRDPNDERRLIPLDVLRARDLKINWDQETISGNALNYAGVHLYAPSEIKEVVATLIGCSLAKCFNRIVLEDWVRLEMQEPAFRRFPYWKISVESYCFHPPHDWPVRFEDWGSPAAMITGIRHPVTVLDRPDPEPPNEIVALRKRLESQTRHFLSWLRDGTIVTTGIVEPKDHKLTRETISPDWWRQAEVEFNCRESSLWNRVKNERVCMFSDIRVIKPPAQTPAPTVAQDEVKGISARGSASGSGELAVWNYLREWKVREPGFNKGRTVAAIARQLGELPEFAGYKPNSLEKYVRRALKAPDF